jgi:hypothetical protein
VIAIVLAFLLVWVVYRAELRQAWRMAVSP